MKYFNGWGKAVTNKQTLPATPLSIPVATVFFWTFSCLLHLKNKPSISVPRVEVYENYCECHELSSEEVKTNYKNIFEKKVFN